MNEQGMKKWYLQSHELGITVEVLSRSAPGNTE